MINARSNLKDAFTVVGVLALILIVLPLVAFIGVFLRLPLLFAVVLAVVVAGGLGLVSDLGYAAPGVDDSELVVTFKHPGQTSQNCRDLTEEERARRPVHMRRDRICDRRRSSVRLWVTLDGATALKSSYPPGGVWGVDWRTPHRGRGRGQRRPERVELHARANADFRWIRPAGDRLRPPVGFHRPLVACYLPRLLGGPLSRLRCDSTLGSGSRAAWTTLRSRDRAYSYSYC